MASRTVFALPGASLPARLHPFAPPRARKARFGFFASFRQTRTPAAATGPLLRTLTRRTNPAPGLTRFGAFAVAFRRAVAEGSRPGAGKVMA